MPRDTYPVDYGKRTWKALVQVEKFGYEMPEVFTDFVHFVLNALLSLTDNMKYGDFTDKIADNRLTGMYEERYMEIVRKYKENQTRSSGDRPADYFKEAWIWLQRETAQTQKDVLGHLYESQITLGRQGQFFTPHQLFRAMADVLSDKAPGEEHKIENVHDPACGSGRAFIVMAQQNLDQPYHFVGIDISPLMARIAAINMWLFGLYADILQGNSLSMEMSCMWQIRPGGWIWESQIKDNKPDGTVEAWSSEYQTNHPPMPEEERQAILADYERWQKIIAFVREMEAQFQKEKIVEQPTVPGEEAPATTAEPPKEQGAEQRQAITSHIAKGCYRVDNYQLAPGDELFNFNVAFVFERQEEMIRVSQACSHYDHERAIYNEHPALLTTDNFVPVFEEEIKALLEKDISTEVEELPASAIETTPQTQAPADVAPSQAQLSIELPPSAQKTRTKKPAANKQTGPIQQSLFDDL